MGFDIHIYSDEYRIHDHYCNANDDEWDVQDDERYYSWG
jgi:hypothetical protein